MLICTKVPSVERPTGGERVAASGIHMHIACGTRTHTAYRIKRNADTGTRIPDI